MYVEKNIVNGFYGAKYFDDSGDDDDDRNPRGHYTVWVISQEVKVTPYTYDEAIGLSGHGAYTAGLLVACGLCMFSMCADMFSFSSALAHASCDLRLGPREHSVLVLMPYLGAMSTAYLWGYVSDTRGRRLSMLASMWGAFLASTLSAFAPNWILLAALKFLSVSFSNGVLSISYTLVGECCPIAVKRAYLFLLSCALHAAMPFYTALGHAFLKLSFSYNLGFLVFTPWRLMVLCLAAPLGVSAACLHCFYESPKFLANIEQQAQALDILRNIWRRNRCLGRKYSVEKLVLYEEGNARNRSASLLQSMKEQTVPLFQSPYLRRTLQLYFLTMVGYSTTNSLLSWFPFITDAFLSGTSSPDAPEGMCRIIEHSQIVTDDDRLSCTPKSNSVAVWASVVQALACIIINVCILKVPNRKALVISMLAVMLLSSLGCAVIPNNIISLTCFFTILVGVVFNGVMSSYFVDLFPTSYRGMAACLSILVGRCSGLVGSYVSGLFIMTSCTFVFYAIAANIFCGMLVACFLPSEKNKNVS